MFTTTKISIYSVFRWRQNVTYEMHAVLGSLQASFKLVENRMILRWSYLQFYTYTTDPLPMSKCCNQKKKKRKIM